MSTEAHKVLIRRLFDEAVNQRESAFLDELISPSLILDPSLPSGPDGVKHIINWLHQAFGQLHYDIANLVSERDALAVRLHAHGIHQGEYLGIPATGKPVDFAEMMFFRFEDERIVEWWIVAQQARILRQIGALPASE
jgi:predicted ester cyclase